MAHDFSHIYRSKYASAEVVNQFEAEFDLNVIKLIV